MLKPILTPRDKNKFKIYDSEIQDINHGIDELEKEKREIIKNKLVSIWGVEEGDILMSKEKKTKYVVCFTPNFNPNTNKGYVYMGLAPMQKGNGKAYNAFRYLTDDNIEDMVKLNQKYTDKIYNYY